MFLHSHITTLKYRPCEHQNCNLQCKMQWIFPTLGLAEERQEQEVQQEGGVVCGHGAGQGGSGRVRARAGPVTSARGAHSSRGAAPGGILRAWNANVIFKLTS